MEHTIGEWGSHIHTRSTIAMTAPMSGNPVGKRKKNRGGVMVMLLFYRSTPEMAHANPRNKRSLLSSTLQYVVTILSFVIIFLSARSVSAAPATRPPYPTMTRLFTTTQWVFFRSFRAHGQDRFRSMSRLTKRSWVPVPGFCYHFWCALLDGMTTTPYSELA